MRYSFGYYSYLVTWLFFIKFKSFCLSLFNRTNNHFRIVYSKSNRLLLLNSKGIRPYLFCGTVLAILRHSNDWILFRIGLLKMNTDVTQTSLYFLAARYICKCNDDVVHDAISGSVLILSKDSITARFVWLSILKHRQPYYRSEHARSGKIVAKMVSKQEYTTRSAKKQVQHASETMVCPSHFHEKLNIEKWQPNQKIFSTICYSSLHEIKYSKKNI